MNTRTIHLEGEPRPAAIVLFPSDAWKMCVALISNAEITATYAKELSETEKPGDATAGEMITDTLDLVVKIMRKFPQCDNARMWQNRSAFVIEYVKGQL